MGVGEATPVARSLCSKCSGRRSMPSARMALRIVLRGVCCDTCGMLLSMFQLMELERILKSFGPSSTRTTVPFLGRTALWSPAVE